MLRPVDRRQYFPDHLVTLLTFRGPARGSDISDRPLPGMGKQRRRRARPIVTTSKPVALTWLNAGPSAPAHLVDEERAKAQR
jgi:hypothetical protein